MSKSTEEILLELATSDPDYPAWAAEFSSATFSEEPLSEELAEAILAGLVEDDMSMRVAIELLRSQTTSVGLFGSTNKTTLPLAIAFLLRKHIKITVTDDEAHTVSIEVEPTLSEHMTTLLNNLGTWLGINKAPPTALV